MIIDVAGLGFQQFEGRFPEPEYQNILIDAHHYQCFENLAGWSIGPFCCLNTD